MELCMPRDPVWQIISAHMVLVHWTTLTYVRLELTVPQEVPVHRYVMLEHTKTKLDKASARLVPLDHIAYTIPPLQLYVLLEATVLMALASLLSSCVLMVLIVRVKASQKNQSALSVLLDTTVVRQDLPLPLASAVKVTSAVVVVLSLLLMRAGRVASRSVILARHVWKLSTPQSTIFVLPVTTVLWVATRLFSALPVRTHLPLVL